MSIIEVRGRSFEVGRLGIDDAFGGLERAQEFFTAPQPPFSKVPGLLRMFAKVAKVARTPDGKFEGALGAGGGFVDLMPFLDDVFRTEHGLAFDFVMQCVHQEFGDFLDGLRAAAADLPAQPPEG